MNNDLEQEKQQKIHKSSNWS